MNPPLFVGAGVCTLDFPPDYFPSDNYSGLHDPLHAKVLLLRQKDTCGAIVTLELPSVRPWELTDELRRFCARTLKVPYENLWLVMTHDLSAPHVPPEPAARQRHMDILRQALERACLQALKAVQPVRAVVRQGQCGVNVNRDVESVQGWWVGINPQRPSDHTLSALVFYGDDGAPAAVLYSYAIKSSVMELVRMSDGKQYASGDVTGLANAKAEAALGCPVLFVMGAAGDQVPREKGNYLKLDATGRFQSVNLAEKSWDILEALSQELCGALCGIVRSGPEQPLTGALHFAHYSLPCQGQLSYPKELPEPPILSYDYPEAPEQLLDVWCVQIGGCALLGVKPEVTTPLFRHLQTQSPFPVTLLATLVNGGQGYIATDFDYDNFTYPGLKTPFRKGTDRLFLQNTLHFLCRLHGDT